MKVERAAAADQKAIFDMGFFMADVRPSLPTVSAEDQQLVFELLKRHPCLEVSAIAMNDLDQDISATANWITKGAARTRAGSSPGPSPGPERENCPVTRVWVLTATMCDERPAAGVLQ